MSPLDDSSLELPGESCAALQLGGLLNREKFYRVSIDVNIIIYALLKFMSPFAMLCSQVWVNEH